MDAFGFFILFGSDSDNRHVNDSNKKVAKDVHLLLNGGSFKMSPKGSTFHTWVPNS